MLIIIAASASQPAIIALLFYYNSKNLNCIGAQSFLRLEEEYWKSPFLLRLEKEYWRSPFFNQFVGMNFQAGNETREINGVILLQNKMKSRAK